MQKKNKFKYPFIIHLGVMLQRKRLRVPWTARRSNQSILKEIDPEYSLEINPEYSLETEAPILWPPDTKS